MSGQHRGCVFGLLRNHDGRPRRSGDRRGGDARARRLDRARLLFRPRDGAGDVAGDDRFHRSAILAPSIGQAILLVAPWRWIFGVLTIFGALVMAWTMLRLRETQAPEDRKPIEVATVVAAFRTTLTTRLAVGYMLAMAFVLGGLFGFINSAQQVFVDVFHAPEWFTTIFALIAMFMAAASLLNSRIVGRLGMRRVSHGALLAYIGLTGTHAVVAWSGHESLWSFAASRAARCSASGSSRRISAPWRWTRSPCRRPRPLRFRVSSRRSSAPCWASISASISTARFVPLTLGFALCGLVALGIVLVAERAGSSAPPAGGPESVGAEPP